MRCTRKISALRGLEGARAQKTSPRAVEILRVRRRGKASSRFREEVYQSWKDKYEELENIYQFKLYEQDADEKLRWIRKHMSYLLQSMGDIGNSEQEANERLKQFDDVEKAVKVREFLDKK